MHQLYNSCNLKKPPRGTLTAEQRALYDRFLNDPSSVEGELPAAVLHALDRELRPVQSKAGFAGVSVGKAPDQEQALLSSLDAASLLGMNLNTFARRVEPQLEAVAGSRPRVYRRSDLVAWQEAQRRR